MMLITKMMRMRAETYEVPKKYVDGLPLRSEGKHLQAGTRADCGWG